MSWLFALACAAALLWAINRVSPWIYDVIIVRMTETWYAAVIARLPANSRVLDVGIGTGSALARNAGAVVAKKLQWVGLDYDRVYVDACTINHATAGKPLAGRLSCVCAAVCDSDLKQRTGNAEFDAIYFSGSISLMPDPIEALHATARLLKAGGKIYVTQTFQRRGAFLLASIKPLLRYLTTIDFGKLVFERDFDAICQRSGLRVLEKCLVPGSVDNAMQAAFLIVLSRDQ